MRALVIMVVLILTLTLSGCAFFTADITGAEAARTEAEELEATIARAQASLGAFTDSLAAPLESQLYFAVLARFALPDEAGHEDLWVENVSYDGEAFTGTLASAPTLWDGAALGETVTTPAADVLDWMIVEETRIVGAYTVRLQRERMTLRERIDFSRQLGLPIVDPE
ncbi:MAG: DUF2314 domain-containing protein [Chloroflexi bacterium]|nr:DUF2314 domain-containing protein [Chloroflexota bacterium]